MEVVSASIYLKSVISPDGCSILCVTDTFISWDVKSVDRLLYRSDPKPASRFRNGAGLGVVVSSKGHGMLRTRRIKAAHHLHT